MIITPDIHVTAAGESFSINRNKFYIDHFGTKFISQQNETDQLIDCNFNDELVCEEGIWRVKNELDVYQEQHAKVKKARQAEYTARVRPYLEEAEIKKHMGDQAEYNRLMDLAVKEREKIQSEHPWPISPEVA
ncbi:hypothetical protein GCM10007938_18340 [Vibrio zhanjiangensis]|uniref:Tail fiber assembly protein n=1 Tax=Vibrio zhanjiangensis TaxID=1046128 RepID=A0ABQ6EZD9_9VIBR|nr:hypothetical protein [Vibrio zhanjiangensis]GLT18056.1 hypothetical protein GCM10007938_18340 [Vibrio zhanjiangensis]